jgi:hypothetical protein
MTEYPALRRAFGSLRAEDARQAPSFDTMVRYRVLPVPPPRLGFILPALTVILLIVALGIGYWRTPSTNSSSPRFILAWRATTDFLLDTPGSQLMRDVPQIGNELPPALTPSDIPSIPDQPHVISEPERHL